jgi:hypothetical protein
MHLRCYLMDPDGIIRLPWLAILADRPVTSLQHALADQHPHQTNKTLRAPARQVPALATASVTGRRRSRRLDWPGHLHEDDCPSTGSLHLLLSSCQQDSQYPRTRFLGYATCQGQFVTVAALLPEPDGLPM